MMKKLAIALIGLFLAIGSCMAYDAGFVMNGWVKGSAGVSSTSNLGNNFQIGAGLTSQAGGINYGSVPVVLGSGTVATIGAYTNNRWPFYSNPSFEVVGTGSMNVDVDHEASVGIGINDHVVTLVDAVKNANGQIITPAVTENRRQSLAAYSASADFTYNEGSNQNGASVTKVTKDLSAAVDIQFKPNGGNLGVPDNYEVFFGEMKPSGEAFMVPIKSFSQVDAASKIISGTGTIAVSGATSVDQSGTITKEVIAHNTFDVYQDTYAELNWGPYDPTEDAFLRTGLDTSGATSFQTLLFNL